MEPDGILSLIGEAVRSVDPSARESLVGDILSSRKVFIYGSGRSGLVGQMFAVRLVQLGLDVHFVGEMTTPIIGREDLTILISFTGRTSSVVQTASIARRIGSRIVCVTGTADCPLTDVSDLSLVMEIPESDDVRRIAPLGTVFEDSALLLFDGIVADIMSREGISEEEMRSRHAIWVRSLLHEGRGEPDASVLHHIDGQLAGDRVHHDEHPRAADLPEHAHDGVGGLGPLGGEEHADLRTAYPRHDGVLALLVGLDPACEPPVGGGPVGGVENGRHGVLDEQNVRRCTHPPCRFDTLRRPQSQTVYLTIGGRPDGPPSAHPSHGPRAGRRGGFQGRRLGTRTGPAAPPPRPRPRCSSRRPRRGPGASTRP